MRGRQQRYGRLERVPGQPGKVITADELRSGKPISVAQYQWVGGPPPPASVTGKNDKVRLGGPVLRESVASPSNPYNSLATLCGLHVMDSMEQPFEILLFVYSLAHLILQHHTIYRSNFLDVDYYAFTFSCVALLRRLFWKAAQATFKQWNEVVERRIKGWHGERGRPSRNCTDSHTAAANSVPTGVNGMALGSQLALCACAVASLLIISAYCGMMLAHRYPSLQMVFVVGPVLTYFGTAGRLLQDPPEKCLRLEWHTEDGEAACRHSCKHGGGGTNGHSRGAGSSQSGNGHHQGGANCPHCSCSGPTNGTPSAVAVSDSGGVGAEDDDKVAYLVLSRSMIAKQCQAIVYAAACNAYYVGVVPCVFVPNEHAYWPPSRSRVLTGVVFLNTLLLLCISCLNRYFLHFVAYVHTYGCWEQVAPDDPSLRNCAEPEPWRNGVVYDRGAVVRYHPDLSSGPAEVTPRVDPALLQRAKIYRGVAFSNSVVPGQWTQVLIYRLFAVPFRAQTALTVTQMVIAVMINSLAIRSVAWYTYSVMAAFNYVLLIIALHQKREARLDRRLVSILGRLSAGLS
eukprot:TRINITY_DN69986_c0_g1_i1.p1 TRINITY_DN69986_c0_g1~~TRINITY_DN69986_c0_g1_i1.p1  ORF type:complete len:636 (+),score=101.10 TRINITY_DN69986_c0_g1_i1:198-1910(+)